MFNVISRKGGFLPLCRDIFGLFFIPSQLGLYIKRGTSWNIIYIYIYVCVCVCVCVCKIYWCREIRNTDDSPLFRYETFINFLNLVCRHEERETQFLLCWLYYLIQQTRCASGSPPAGLARPRVGSQLTSFSKSPSSPPIDSGFDVIHTPVLFPLWGFYYDICDCHILCARAWTVLNVCAHALRDELFKAQPNRMIKYN